MAHGSEGPCDLATAIAYIAEPAPSKRGVISRLGELRALIAAAGVETGRVVEPLEALAQRIVARLRASGLSFATTRAMSFSQAEPAATLS